MTWKREITKLALIAGVFAACWFMPDGNLRFDNAGGAALRQAPARAKPHGFRTEEGLQYDVKQRQ